LSTDAILTSTVAIVASRHLNWQRTELKPVARGAACNRDLLLDVDFFQNANEPLEEIRARFAIQRKSPTILELDPFGL
jgi:hypothetical protein